VVAASSPATAAAVLRGVPEDELARMAVQAAAFGSAELSRVADLVNQTLTEMTGATSPRLHLELMLARVLVPSADDSERGALARVEQLERRVAGGEFAAGRAATPDGDRVTESRAPASAPSDGRAGANERVDVPAPSVERAAAAPTEIPRDRAPSAGVDTPAVPAPRPAEADTASGEPQPKRAPAPNGPVTLKQIRDAWPEVLASLQRTKRTAWMAALSAQVLEYRADDVLVLGFASQSDVQGLRSGTGNQNSAELLRTAIHEVLGVTVKFLPRVVGANATPDPAANEAAVPPQGSAPAAGATTHPAQPVDRPAPNTPAPKTAPAPKAAAPVATGASVPAGPVDSWATVAIPRDPAPEAEVARGTESRPRAATMIAEREVVPEAPDDAPPIDERDAPPEDTEPPFDAGPEPEVVVEASVSTSAPSVATTAARAQPAPAKAAPSKPRRAPATRAATDDGLQRYGEAVVREVLGATFIEETEAPPARTGFGERG
jgi:DNA polymerase-3 subunit gamma/tau